MPRKQLVVNLSHPQSNLQLAKVVEECEYISQSMCVYSTTKSTKVKCSSLSVYLFLSLCIARATSSQQHVPLGQQAAATAAAVVVLVLASEATCTSSQIQSVRATWWPLDDAVCGCLSISLLPFLLLLLPLLCCLPSALTAFSCNICSCNCTPVWLLKCACIDV